MKISITIDPKQLSALDRALDPAKIKSALAKAVHAEAHFLAGKVKEKIRSGPFTPLSPLTLASRRLKGQGGTKPLVASGALFQSIGVYPPRVGGLEKFVGVVRRSSGAGNAVDIAQIMEEGRTFVLSMTPKMRRFIFGVLFPAAGITPSGGGTAKPYIVISIPPRPFLGPTMEAHTPGTIGRITDSVRTSLGW